MPVDIHWWKATLHFRNNNFYLNPNKYLIFFFLVEIITTFDGFIIDVLRAQRTGLWFA
jgi:hypothetical protein